MTAPFKPTLVSPGNPGTSGTSVTFQFAFNAFTPGETAHQYTIRRRKLSPSVGTSEYWTGAAWGAETWLSAPANTYDGDVISVVIGTGWVNGETWEWSVKFRNTGLEASPEADANYLSIYAAPTVTISIANPILTTRPEIKWSASLASGRRQKSYQFGIWDSTVYGQSGFDPSLQNWQALAAWVMPTPRYSSLDNSITPDKDLENGKTYRVYGYITDDYDRSTGWTNTTFTSSFTPPGAPAVAIYQDPTDEGAIVLECTSSFNLLSPDQSSFETSVGLWQGTHNCDVLWNESDKTMIIRRAGRSYADQDAAYASFTAEDTALTTFEAARTTDAAPTGESQAHSSDATVGNMMAVTASATYSAVATVINPPVTVNVQVNIEWYTGAGAFISQSDGTLTQCNAGATTNVYINAAASPGTAAFARVEIRVVTATYGDYKIDSVAFARSNSIQWSPGSTGVDVTFVVQKTKDGGATWEPVWNATFDSPWPTSALSNDTAVVKDRAAWLNTENVQYRIYAITTTTSGPLVSSPTVVDAPFIQAMQWWLRHVAGSLSDVRIRAESFTTNTEKEQEVISPENKELSYVVTSASAKQATLEIDCYTLDLDEYTKMEALLESYDPLYLQRNIGDGFLFQRTGRVRKFQKRAADPAGNYVRHYHSFSFQGQIISFEDAV